MGKERSEYAALPRCPDKTRRANTFRAYRQKESPARTGHVAVRGLGGSNELPRSSSISYDPIGSRPFEGPFLLEKTECRIGEMNIERVAIAGASIGLSVRLRATALRAVAAEPALHVTVLEAVTSMLP